MRPHGTFARYVHNGCRCDECREANRLQYRRVCDGMEARGREDPSLIPHGTDGGYKNWGCRCAECTAVHSAACANYRERRKAPSP